MNNELNEKRTGYPSIDRPWLKYYKDNAEDFANNIPLNKTVWDVIEEKLLEYYDIPALEYFKREFSRQEFIDLCYIWARTFRAMGVEEDEIVPIYGPLVPDIGAMVFGLNMIGACPYFLKLAISKEALAEETKDSKIAVVYDGMWANVANEFMKDRFKKVIVASVPEYMPAPLKQIIKFKDVIDSRKNKSRIPNEKKYIWADKAREIANYYTGHVKVPFVPGRSAFITSSSGTTIGGVVKGTVATNESTISQLWMATASDTQFFPGDRVLNSLPLTASTSLNLLFIMGLYSGETVLIDPRITSDDFYRQLIEMKPNQALHTGSMWEEFFNRVSKEMDQGREFDFSCAKGWTIGGEGTDVKKYLRWNEIMKKAHAKEKLISGYGLSELFSAVSAEKVDARYDCSKQIMSVGIPYAGMNVGVFDENGNELSYNQRGELRIKSKSAMKEYYGKPELTKSKFDNGWLKTGDMAEIDENGFIYVWGRYTDVLEIDGKKLYTFDIANKIKEKGYIDDAIVLLMPTDENDYNLVAHIVWNKGIINDDKTKYINDLNEWMSSYLPEGIVLNTYSEHDGMIPYSPTTLKKDKNRLVNQTTGFIQINDGKLEKIEFLLSSDGKHYVKTVCDIGTKRLIKRR